MASAGGGWRSKARRVTYSIESLGWGRGVLETLTHRLPYDPERDHAFDRRFGTDTAGAVEADELGIVDAERRDQAIRYLPSPVRVTRWMLDHVDVDHRDVTFVDIGCGKGRVLLVASEYPFRRIVGVEISPELSAIARRNAARFASPARRCDDIAVETTDATAFDFPAGELLVHLYHPFAPEVTADVLRRLESSVAAEPRRVTIAYLAYSGAIEAVEAVFAGCPWLRPTRSEQSVRGHYNWLLYAN